MRKIILTVSILSLFVLSCSNNKTTDGISTDVVNIDESASGTPTDSHLPNFSFEKEAHDFGKIIQGEKVTHSFKFKNTGGSDLIIAAAQGSCGCTVPKFPRTPIAPGAEDIIDVTFDSDGKSGKVEKKISVTANTSPNIKVLTITAEVEVPEEK